MSSKLKLETARLPLPRMCRPRGPPEKSPSQLYFVAIANKKVPRLLRFAAARLPFWFVLFSALYLFLHACYVCCIVMSRCIVIGDNSAWSWNSCYVTNKPLMSYGTDKESSEHEEIPVIDIPIIAEVEVDNREGMVSTSQRPQRTIILPARLQDCEVVVDDEFTPDGDLVIFSLRASDEPVNYIEALKDFR
ncbi:hypothetical protein KIW84_063132 [Lathyrus oleraceus]|uniref:Uncharacterized protein n=1 Tax=Pisum sativum TaxID=3888 RepID=A0A9D5A4F1_PEA|nr:hypothetical protein KIW84_063132 [Pisum sativum]